MIVKLRTNHSRTISTAFLVVLVLSVLQFCTMSVASGSEALSASVSTTTAMGDHRTEMASDSAGTHDCCTEQSTEEMDTVCPDCEGDETALQTSAPDHLKPLYVLLYITLWDTLVFDRQSGVWSFGNEPDVTAYQPDIYLANASFLE